MLWYCNLKTYTCHNINILVETYILAERMSIDLDLEMPAWAKAMEIRLRENFKMDISEIKDDMKKMEKD